MTTERKTRSLSLSANPVARMRELHELDSPSPATTPTDTGQPHSPAAFQEPANAATQQPSNITIQTRSNTETQPPSSISTEPSENPPTQQRTSAATPKRQPQASLHDDSNPVHHAMRQALLQPFSNELRKGPTTATTIRLPSELWERLDMASTLLEQTRQDIHHKQDIIAEALKAYLARIGRGEL